MTSLVVSSDTDTSAIAGYAYCRSVFSHWAACLALRHVGRSSSSVDAAASSNVGTAERRRSASGVAAPFGYAGVLEGGRPGIGQRDDRIPAQTDFACAPSDGDALHPALRALRRDHEPEAVAAASVAVLPRGRGLHQRCSQSLGASDFCSPQYFPVYGWEYTALSGNELRAILLEVDVSTGNLGNLRELSAVAGGGGAEHESTLQTEVDRSKLYL